MSDKEVHLKRTQMIYCDECGSSEVAHYNKPIPYEHAHPDKISMDTVVERSQGPISVKPAIHVRPMPKRLECMRCGYMVEYRPDGSLSIVPEVARFKITRVDTEASGSVQMRADSQG